MKAVERGAPAAANTRGTIGIGVLFAVRYCRRSGAGKYQCPDRAPTSVAARRCHLAARRRLLADLSWRTQCSTHRSPVSVALFWVAVAVVVLVTIFPQFIANWLAG
jgi:hypothetical protein